MPKPTRPSGVTGLHQPVTRNTPRDIRNFHRTSRQVGVTTALGNSQTAPSGLMGVPRDDLGPLMPVWSVADTRTTRRAGLKSLVRHTVGVSNARTAFAPVERHLRQLHALAEPTEQQREILAATSQVFPGGTLDVRNARWQRQAAHTAMLGAATFHGSMRRFAEHVREQWVVFQSRDNMRAVAPLVVQNFFEAPQAPLFSKDDLVGAMHVIRLYREDLAAQLKQTENLPQGIDDETNGPWLYLRTARAPFIERPGYCCFLDLLPEMIVKMAMTLLYEPERPGMQWVPFNVVVMNPELKGTRIREAWDRGESLLVIGNAEDREVLDSMIRGLYDLHPGMFMPRQYVPAFIAPLHAASDPLLGVYRMAWPLNSLEEGLATALQTTLGEIEPTHANFAHTLEEHAKAVLGRGLQ